MLGRRHKGDDDAAAFELLVDEGPEPLGTSVVPYDEPEAPEQDVDPGAAASLEEKIDQLTRMIAAAPSPQQAAQAETEALRKEFLAAFSALGERLQFAVTELGDRLKREVAQLRATAVSQAGRGGPAGQAADGAEIEKLRAELKAALMSLSQQLQAALGKVNQRVTDETSQVRGAVEAAVAVLAERPASDRQERMAGLTTSNELIRSLFSEHRRELDALLGGSGLAARLTEEREALRTELMTLLRDFDEQRENDRRERRTELRSALTKTVETMRSVLVEERQEQKSQFQVLLADALRQRANDWQELRTAVDEAVAGTRERSVAVAQLSQRMSELRAEVQAAAGRSQDDGRLSEQLAELRKELESTAASAAEQRALEVAQLRSEVSEAVSRMYEQQAAQWQQLRAAFDASLDRSGERMLLAVAELGERLAEVRGDFHLRLGGLDEQVAHMAGEVDVRMGRLDEQVAHLAGEVDVRMGRLDEQFGAAQRARGTEVEELVARIEATLRSDRDERAAGEAQQRAEVLRAVEAAARQQAGEQAELRRSLASVIEGANASLVSFRDDLYERLETIVDVTAQSSASAAASVKALRRDLERMDGLHQAVAPAPPPAAPGPARAPAPQAAASRARARTPVPAAPRAERTAAPGTRAKAPVAKKAAAAKKSARRK